MKKIMCKEWFDAIAAYKTKEHQGKCETCLYQNDNPCPHDSQTGEESAAISRDYRKNNRCFAEYVH